MTNPREEISAAVLKAAHDLRNDVGAPEFKVVFGHVLDDEAGDLAKRKFQATQKGSERITPEEAKQRIRILFGKDFAR
jgi:hypothetical protein